MTYVWTSGMCLWTGLHLTKQSADILTTVTSHFKDYAHIFPKKLQLRVCVVGVILLAKSTEVNVLNTDRPTEQSRPLSVLLFIAARLSLNLLPQTINDQSNLSSW